MSAEDAGGNRARLRHGTAAAHRALEAALALEARLHDRREVTLVLARLHGFFASLEPALDRLLGDAMAGRHRIDDLAHDLRSLGLVDAEIDRLPRCTVAGSLDGRAEALGALYVVEGARLGGRVINRRARDEPWAAGKTLRFWSDHSDGGASWRSLETLIETVDQPDALVRGANDTFGRLHAWLDAGGVTVAPG